MNKKISAILLLCALIVSAIPTVSVYTQGVPNLDTLTYVTVGTPETVDPAWAYDTASAELISNVNEPLLTFDGASTDKFVPMLAESWPGSDLPGRPILSSPPDPLAPPSTVETFYFKIRSNVSWQDSAYGYVTPQDVEYSFERGMVMDHGGGPQWMTLERLLGVETTRQFDLFNDVIAAQVGHMIDDAVQCNATHVWFNIMQPQGSFQQGNIGVLGVYPTDFEGASYSGPSGYIVCKEWTTNSTLETGPQDNFPGFDVTGYINWRDYNNPDYPGPLMDEKRMMGTGPYTLDYLDTDPVTGWYRLEANPDYWQGWDGPHVDTVIVKSVADWATRKAMFTSEDPVEQADLCCVPMENSTELYGEQGIRFMYGIEMLAADALFFNTAVNPISPYMPYIGDGGGGWIPKPDLFSDRHMRLAFAYSVNMTQLMEELSMGEGFSREMVKTLSDTGIFGVYPTDFEGASCTGVYPTDFEGASIICDGVKYHNDSKPYYDQDLAKATYHFQMAWGGIDYEGDGVCDEPGDVWNLGFMCPVAANEGNTAREMYVLYLRCVIENEIPWEIPALWVDIEPWFIPWSTYIQALSNNHLPAFVNGWHVDFEDPHDCIQPFMHTQGYFGNIQSLNYGLDPESLNWHPDGNYGQNGLPYCNYQGDLVTELNNTYVDDLIETGIQTPDGPVREQLYTELTDIFYAECFAKMLWQPSGRHWERDWVQGWYYNPLRQGYYFYDLWKEDAATVTRDLAAYCICYDPDTGMTYTCDIYPRGETWEYYAIDLTYWDSSGNKVTLYNCTAGWIPPGCNSTTEGLEIPVGNYYGKAAKAYIHIHNWIRTFDMTPIPDDNPSDNTCTKVCTREAGDLGGGIPPKFFNFDGKVDAKDFALFLIRFRGTNPFS